MQNIKRDGKKSQAVELEIILAAEMGLLSTLKRIRFNPNPPGITQNTITPNQTRLVDFHVEISKKIDEVIQKHEEENTIEQRIIEPRTTWTKTPQSPVFKTDVLTDLETASFDNELFELEIPTEDTVKQNLSAKPNIETPPIFVGPVQNQNTQSIFAVGNHDEDKLLTSLGRIKVNKEKLRNANKNKTKKNNGYSKAKNNYQETKIELEKKKHELEEMKKLAKKKEEELKKKEQERKEKEKKKAIEQKKREREEKLKAKQELKLSKEKEREKKKKLKEIEKLKLEKQKQQELKEKQKTLKENQLKDIEKNKAKPISLSFLKKKETIVEPDIKTTKKEVETNIQPPEDDLIKAFGIIDELLGKLPDETIDEFVKSDDFEIYEKVVSRYKKK